PRPTDAADDLDAVPDRWPWQQHLPVRGGHPGRGRRIDPREHGRRGRRDAPKSAHDPPREGADWVKRCTSGGVMSPGDDVTPHRAHFTGPRRIETFPIRLLRD